MITLLNGCAASGKGTLARKLASYVGLPYHDFGLIFRAIALLNQNAAWDDVVDMVKSRSLRSSAGKIILRDTDISALLSSEDVGLLAARLAQSRGEALPALGKAMVLESTFVADGRTVSQIFPDADWHFELVIDQLAAVARRRAQGGDPGLFQERWRIDAKRMARSSRAIVINTTGRTVQESLNEILEHLGKGLNI